MGGKMETKEKDSYVKFVVVKEKIFVGFTPIPTILDIGLRVALYVLYRLRIIDGWLLWILFLVSFFIIIGISVDRGMRVDKKILPDTSKYEVAIKGNFWSSLTIILNLIIGSTIFLLSMDKVVIWLRIILFIIVIAIFLIYTIGLFFFSPQSRILQPKRTVPTPEFEICLKDNDVNDSHIIKVGSEFHSMISNVEAYTLESTLFGGLAFSAFITLITQNPIVLTYSQNFLINIGLLFNQIFALKFPIDAKILSSFIYSESLFATLSVLCLLTSLFFVLVIISKVRFHSLEKHARVLVDQTKYFIDQENNPSGDGFSSINDQLDYLHNRISMNFDSVEKSFTELKGIVHFMNTFRWLGLISFLGLIVISGLLLSTVFGLIIFFVILMIILASSIDKIVREKHLTNMVLKFIQRSSQQP